MHRLRTMGPNRRYSSLKCSSVMIPSFAIVPVVFPCFHEYNTEESEICSSVNEKHTHCALTLNVYARPLFELNGLGEEGSGTVRYVDFHWL